MTRRHKSTITLGISNVIIIRGRIGIIVLGVSFQSHVRCTQSHILIAVIS